MSFTLRCEACNWVGDESEADPGMPADVDASEFEPGDYADETMVKCPSCEGSLTSAE